MSKYRSPFSISRRNPVPISSKDPRYKNIEQNRSRLGSDFLIKPIQKKTLEIKSEAPSIVVNPSISPETGYEGITTFEATIGTWANDPTSYTYQWEFNDQGSVWIAIAGANNIQYTPPLNYITYYGTSLRFYVKAKNSFGSTIAYSNIVTVNSSIDFNDNIPQNLSTPVVSPTSGIVQNSGSTTFSTTNGSWSNSPTSYTYQWEYLSESGDWYTIDGATLNSYQPALSHPSLYTSTIRCSVIAYNDYGASEASAASNSASLSINVPVVLEVPYSDISPSYTIYNRSSSNYFTQFGAFGNGYWLFNTPYNFIFNGQSYNKLYIHENSFVTFSAPSFTTVINESTPALDKIAVAAENRSSALLLWYADSSQWKFKIFCGSNNSFPSSDIVWTLSSKLSDGIKKLRVDIVADDATTQVPGTTMVASANKEILDMGLARSSWVIESQ